MRVGFSGFVLQGGKTGIATYCVELLRALGEQPVEVIPFVTEEEASLLPLASQTVANRWGYPLANILWHHALLPQWVKKLSLDVVHIPSIRRLPLWKSAPLVATVHDLAPLLMPKKYGFLRHCYHRYVLSRAIRNCDGIIAVSENTKQDILAHFEVPEERIRVIYPGIDHALTHPMEKGQALRLLMERWKLSQPFMVYVSRLEHPGKNHIRLIQAFERFKKRQKSPLKLVLAGAEWNGAEKIKACAAQSPYAQDILLPGFVSAEEVQALYRACNLMVFPSLYEGFGFPVLEAMACGAPVVCSYTSSLRELAEGRVPTFDPYSVPEMCEAIERGLGESQDLVAYARSFTWAEAARKTLAFYETVATSESSS